MFNTYFRSVKVLDIYRDVSLFISLITYSDKLNMNASDMTETIAIT